MVPIGGDLVLNGMKISELGDVDLKAEANSGTVKSISDA